MRNGVEIEEVENGYIVEISYSEPLKLKWGEASGKPAFYKKLEDAQSAAIEWIVNGVIPKGDK